MKNNWDNVLFMLLSPAEAVLLMVLMERAGNGDKDEFIPITNKTLETLTNVPYSRVYSITENLIKLNLVGVDEKREGKNTWSYCVDYSNVNKVIDAIKSFNPNNEPLTYSNDNTAIHDMIEYCESYRKSCGLDTLRDIRKRKGKRKTNSGDNTIIGK